MMTADLNLIEQIDNGYNKVFRTARIQIERTKTNRELLAIEETYFPRFRRLFKQIVTEYEGRLHFIHEAEKRYGEEIKVIIKSMVTKTYLLGLDYVSRSTNKPYLIDLNSIDITNITTQTDEAYRMFWRLVTKYLQVLKNRQRTTTTTTTTMMKIAQKIDYYLPDSSTDVTLMDDVFNTSDWEDNRLLDTDTNAALLINGIATTTLAFATLEKYKQVKEEQQILANIEQESRAGQYETLDADIFAPEEYTPETEFTRTQGMESRDTVVFATEKDAKVCPICSELEGTEWDLDDVSITVPRADTHPNCRCRLLLKINGRIMAK